MAIKKRGKRKVPKRNKNKASGIPFFKDERFHFIIGILILIIASYLLISLISFLFFGAADHSKLDINAKELVFNSSINVQNKAGKTGAYVSDLIINKGFWHCFFYFYLYFIFIWIKGIGQETS